MKHLNKATQMYLDCATAVLSNTKLRRNKLWKNRHYKVHEMIVRNSSFALYRGVAGAWQGVEKNENFCEMFYVLIIQCFGGKCFVSNQSLMQICLFFNQTFPLHFTKETAVTAIWW